MAGAGRIRLIFWSKGIDPGQFIVARGGLVWHQGRKTGRARPSEPRFKEREAVLLKGETIEPYLMADGGEIRREDAGPIFAGIGRPAVYEVIRIVAGRPLFWEDHLARMRRSAKMIGEEITRTDTEIRADMGRLAALNRPDGVHAKLVWSKPGGDERFLAYFIPAESPGPDARRTGIHTIRHTGVRETPHLKTVNARFRDRITEARQREGAYEALLVDEDGYVTEGSRSNFFAVVGQTFYTPPSHAVLPGVTRHQVMAICDEIGVEVVEQPIHEDDLAGLDGAFITGTTVDVMPIGSVDEIRLGSVSHPVIREIVRRYEARVAAYLESDRKPWEKARS